MSAAPAPPLTREPLWTPEHLHARLGDEALAVLDVRPTHQVMEGVIPGAAHLDIYGLGVTRTTPELFEEWITLMRSLLAMRGVSPERTVVVYEHDQTGIRAARAFWLLEYLGHGDVHVLDGGLAAWTAAGHATTREMAPPPRGSLRDAPVRPELFVSADDLNGRLGQDDLAVLDTRSDDEHYGRNTRGGPRGGTIPGAVHLEYTRYLDDSGRMKGPTELLSIFEKSGITRDKAVVPF